MSDVNLLHPIHFCLLCLSLEVGLLQPLVSQLYYRVAVCPVEWMVTSRVCWSLAQRLIIMIVLSISYKSKPEVPVHVRVNGNHCFRAIKGCM